MNKYSTVQTNRLGGKLKNNQQHIKKLEKAVAELNAIVDKLILIQTREGTIGPRNLADAPDLILEVQKIISRNARVELMKIMSLPKRGKEKVSDARMIAMALCGKYKLANTYEIASRFGRKCHSSVSHAIKRASILMETSASFHRLYELCDKDVKQLVNADKEPEYSI